MLQPNKPIIANMPPVAVPRPRLLGAANRRAVCGLHAAHFDPDLDASAAAAVGLRQSSGAHARDRDDLEKPAARAILRNRLAGHSQPDHGSDRAAAGARHEHLPRRPGVHRRDVRAHHFRRAGAQPRADRPLVGVPAVRVSAAVQFRLPRRLDELHFRHRRRAVGAGRLDRPARARLAVALCAVDGLRASRCSSAISRRSAFTASACSRSRLLRLWEQRREPWPRPHRRFRRQRAAVPCRGAAALLPARPCSSSAALIGTSAARSTG